MARLLDPSLTPPKGWRYKQVETGCELHAFSKPDLEAKVFRHREYRKLPRLTRDEIGLDIERQICSQINNDTAFCRLEKNEHDT